MFRISQYGFCTDIRISYNRKVFKSYRVWSAMIHRCYNERHPSYNRYGAKGITVCDEWRLFSNFKNWYDENYVEGYQLDKDLSGLNEYSPDGCRFVSAQDNLTEANSRRKYDISGEKNYNYKDAGHYKDKPMLRKLFLRACREKGWDINNFEQVFAGWRSYDDGTRRREYYYIVK